MNMPADFEPPCTDRTYLFDWLINHDDGKRPGKKSKESVEMGRSICDDCTHKADCLQIGVGLPGMYGGRMSSERGGLGLGAGAA